MLAVVLGCSNLGSQRDSGTSLCSGRLCSTWGPALPATVIDEYETRVYVPQNSDDSGRDRVASGRRNGDGSRKIPTGN